MPQLAPPGARLYECLRPIAEVLGQRSRRLARLARTAVTDLLAWPDFAHTCDIACFYTYERLGGDPRYPDEFDWIGMGVLHRPPRVDVNPQGLFLREAQRQLTSELQGAHTVYGDYRARRGCTEDREETSGKHSPHGGLRKIPAPGMWSCWDTTYGGCWGLTQEQEVNELPELIEALGAILSEKEIHFLTEVHVKGRRPRDVAKEYAPTDSRYGDSESGWVRAEHMIQKTVMRAAHKAKIKLDPRWRVVA